MKQLNCINNLHNFIVLLALYGDDYETEMHRSMLLEKLQHIHENLCLCWKRGAFIINYIQRTMLS